MTRDQLTDVDELDESTAADYPTCSYCGCWEGDACLLEAGGRCSWFRVTPAIAVCSAPECVQAYLADTAAP